MWVNARNWLEHAIGQPAAIPEPTAARALAPELLQRLPRIRSANPRGIVAEFARSIAEELDFLGEAARMDEWNRIMRVAARPEANTKIIGSVSTGYRPC